MNSKGLVIVIFNSWNCIVTSLPDLQSQLYVLIKWGKFFVHQNHLMILLKWQMPDPTVPDPASEIWFSPFGTPLTIQIHNKVYIIPTTIFHAFAFLPWSVARSVIPVSYLFHIIPWNRTNFQMAVVTIKSLCQDFRLYKEPQGTS